MTQFASWWSFRGHPHALTIVQYLVRRTKLLYITIITACKLVKWLLRYKPRKSVTTAGRPAAHTRKFPLFYERLYSLVRNKYAFPLQQRSCLSTLCPTRFQGRRCQMNWIHPRSWLSGWCAAGSTSSLLKEGTFTFLDIIGTGLLDKNLLCGVSPDMHRRIFYRTMFPVDAYFM